MAYTKRLERTATLDSTTKTITGPTQYVELGDKTVVYYMKITFGESGVAMFKPISQKGPSSTYDPRLEGYVSTSDAFDDTRGRPSSYIASGSNIESSAIYVEVNGGGTYYFWWRATQYIDSGSVNSYISLTPGATLWKSHYNSVGEIHSTFTDITAIRKKTVEYFGVRTVGGTIRVRCLQAAQIYITTSSAFNPIGGRPVNILAQGTDEAEYTLYAPEGETVSWYVWIRGATEESEASDVIITIIPPGILWDVKAYDSETAISTSGKSWNVWSGALLDHNVYYIPVKFSNPGEYTISANGGGNTYGYLTTSPRIKDEDGTPYYTPIGYDEPDRGGFSFKVSISGSNTYYLMFRTWDGSPNNLSFTVDVAYTGAVWKWAMHWTDVGTRTSQYRESVQYNKPSSVDRAYMLYRRTVTFSAAGFVSIYSEPPSPTYPNIAYPCVWLTVHSSNSDYDYENGTPPSGLRIIAQDLNENGNRQFKLENVVVEPGTYDIWFRLVDGSLLNRTGYIYIDPPGVGTEWWVADRTDDAKFTNLSADVYDEPHEVVSLRIVKFKLSFATDGTVRITTKQVSGSSLTAVPVKGYVGTTNANINKTTGVPLSYDQASDGNPDFTLSFTATAGTIYYFWLRGGNEATGGEITFTIEVPGGGTWLLAASRPDVVNPASQSVIDSFTVMAGYVYKTKVSFQRSGEAKFYSQGERKLVAFLTESDSGGIDPATGNPYATAVASDTSGDGNYDITYSVESGKTYYLWVHAVSTAMHGAMDAVFWAPEVSSTFGYWICIDRGNGKEWVRATSYIFTTYWREVLPYIYMSAGWKGD